MSDAAASPRMQLARCVARHSLGWLIFANAVGVWLAVLLLWPGVGDWLGPLTYGRWMPVHMNAQLYGWCSLPLIGVLAIWYFDRRRGEGTSEMGWAVSGWTLALAIGVVSWLAGKVSGKLFLDWDGWTRGLLPAAMLGLWGVFAVHTRSRWAEFSVSDRWGRGASLAALFVVPFVFFWASGRAVYPAVNRDSGGATGAALLGSTLGLITIFRLLPELMNLPRRPGAPGRTSDSSRIVTGALGASWVAFALMRHGDSSHHDLVQRAGLAVLFIWVPLVAVIWRSYVWPAGCAVWGAAAWVWWALLVASGWLTFLPGWSEQWKFTHVLVAHAHLAMAGLVTSAHGALLVAMTGRPVSRRVFWLWQFGCVGYVAATMALGMQEVARMDELMLSGAWAQRWLEARLAAGLVMTVASALWWWEWEGGRA